MVKSKKAWIRIMEATIAVMIVSGVMIVVYSGQVNRETSSSDYFYSLQRQILLNVALSSELRINVLNSDDENTNQDFLELNAFINESIPDTFGYYVKVCNLSATSCKMDRDSFIETLENDIYVEDTIISADLGSGDDAVGDEPKILRLFVWERR